MNFRLRLLPIVHILVTPLFLSAANPDHSRVPGIVIDHSPASSRCYIGSPSIAILPDGSYLASHDIFGPGSSVLSGERTRVFASSDKGITWQQVAAFKGMFWGKLFVHQNTVYLLGTEKGYSHILIRKSTDNGRHWTEPVDSHTGIIKTGTYHCAPMPVLIHNGRIWRSFEYNTQVPGPWGINFQAGVISAPVDANLLDSANWQVSNFVPRDPAWLDGQFNAWLEGNVVLTPAGKLVNILRVDTPAGNKAAVVNIADDGKTASFDPATGFIDMPGGAKKFSIRFDPVSKQYFALTNTVDTADYGNRKAASIRNTLSLAVSTDLKNWKIIATLLHHDEVDKHGFQYPDWQFEGDDIIYVSRTAFDDGLGGAHNAHDANYLTFHRINNFRQLSQPDAASSVNESQTLIKLDQLRPGQTVTLFDGQSMGSWKIAEFENSGNVHLSDESIVMEAGHDMTGITWPGPVMTMDYEITLQARRLAGSDFFCGLTFPVAQSHCSFICGGWGGSLCGLSNLDHYDAANNETTTAMTFEENRWYNIRVRVSENKIEAWIDNDQKVDAITLNRKITIRYEMEPCRPLGVATWQTSGAIRNFNVRKLTEAEIKKLKTPSRPFLCFTEFRQTIRVIARLNRSLTP